MTNDWDGRHPPPRSEQGAPWPWSQVVPAAPPERASEPTPEVCGCDESKALRARVARLEGELDLVHRKLGFAGPMPFPQEQVVAEIARLRSTESTIANRVLDQIYGARGTWEARLIAIRAKYSAPSAVARDDDEPLAQPVEGAAVGGEIVAVSLRKA